MDKVGENKDLEKKATHQRSPAWPQAQDSRSGLVWLPFPLEEAWDSWTLLLVPRALGQHLETPASVPQRTLFHLLFVSLLFSPHPFYMKQEEQPLPHFYSPFSTPSFLVRKKHPVIRIPKRLSLLFHVTWAGQGGGGGRTGHRGGSSPQGYVQPALALRCPPWPQLHKHLRTPQGLEDFNWVGVRAVTPIYPQALQRKTHRHIHNWCTQTQAHLVTHRDAAVCRHTESWSTHKVATAQTHIHT